MPTGVRHSVRGVRRRIPEVPIRDTPERALDTAPPRRDEGRTERHISHYKIAGTGSYALVVRSSC
jgi:hypothetical protein